MKTKQIKKTVFPKCFNCKGTGSVNYKKCKWCCGEGNFQTIGFMLQAKEEWKKEKSDKTIQTAEFLSEQISSIKFNIEKAVRNLVKLTTLHEIKKQNRKLSALMLDLENQVIIEKLNEKAKNIKL